MSKSKFEKIYESLKMSELNLIEQKSGMGLATLGDESAPKAAIMTALAWIIKKRENPSFTYEEAGELTQAEVNDILGTSGDDDEGND